MKSEERQPQEVAPSRSGTDRRRFRAPSKTSKPETISSKVERSNHSKFELYGAGVKRAEFRTIGDGIFEHQRRSHRHVQVHDTERPRTADASNPEPSIFRVSRHSIRISKRLNLERRAVKFRRVWVVRAQAKPSHGPRRRQLDGSKRPRPFGPRT